MPPPAPSADRIAMLEARIAELERTSSRPMRRLPRLARLRLNGHRMSSGTQSYDNTRKLILTDAATGAEVYITTLGHVEVKNTHATRPLAIAGLSIFSTTIEAESASLLPGQSATFNTQTIHSRYLDLALTLQGATVPQTRFSHLFCALADLGGGPPSTQSCMVTGRG